MFPRSGYVQRSAQRQIDSREGCGVDTFFAAVNLSAAAYCYAGIAKFVHFQLLAKISIVQIYDYIKSSGTPLTLVFDLPRSISIVALMRHFSCLDSTPLLRG